MTGKKICENKKKKIWVMVKKRKENEFKYSLNGMTCFCGVCHYLKCNHISGIFCFTSKSARLSVHDRHNASSKTAQLSLLGEVLFNIWKMNDSLSMY